MPTFTLGVANASPLEMAEAYATFAARGLHCDSQPVTEIQDSAGTLLKEYLPNCTQVLPQATADAVNDVLRGVQEPGGFGYDNGGTGLSVPSAAKTGTTQDGKSVWFVGYTTQLATAAMIAGATKDGQRPMELAGPDDRRDLHLRGVRLRLRRPDVGRRDAGDPGPVQVGGLRRAVPERHRG